MAPDIWERFRLEFQDERSLPNGRVEATSLADWQALLRLIDTERWPAQVRRGGQVEPLSEGADDLFSASDLLTVAVWPGDDDLQLNFFPYVPSAIDFDFDTAEVRDERVFRTLCDALRRIAQGLSKDIILSHEGADDSVFVRVSTDGQVHWTASAP